MKQLGGLALVATLLSGSVSADLITLDFTPNGSVINRHYDGIAFTSTVVASVSGSETTQLHLPAGPLTMEHLSSDYDASNLATITNGFSAFENYSLDAVVQPFAALLVGYLPTSFSTLQGYSVLSAGNWFWDFDAEAEAAGEVDYGANHVAFQFDRWEVIASSTDDLGSSTTTMFQSFNFLISLGALPTSGADVELRSADDVRALFNSLNGEVGYFNSSVSVQHGRCEQSNCWQTGSDSWRIRGQVSAQGAVVVPVPVPATLLLLAFGLPLMLRRKRV